MKKRFLILTTILLVCVTAVWAVGCTPEPGEPTEAPTEAPEPQLHTVAPTEQQEVEWAPVDSDLRLEDQEAVYAQKDDFLMFGVFGSTDEDGELRFILNDETAQMMSEQEVQEYYLVLNEALIGTVTVSEDGTTVTLKGGYTYYELCQLATQIRGLN